MIIGSNPGLTGPIVVYIIQSLSIIRQVAYTMFIQHVLRALTFSQLVVIHVLQADPSNRIPACSLAIASVITLRSRL